MVGTKRNLADMVRDSWEQDFYENLPVARSVGLRLLFLGCRTQSAEKTVKFATEYETYMADFLGYKSQNKFLLASPSGENLKGNVE